MQQIALPPIPPKRDPLRIQRAVLIALVIRELRARVQGQWYSLMWMVAEPLAHVLLLLALFGVRHSVVTVSADYPVFLVTGLLPFFMFRNLARRVPQAVAANRGLFAYRQVMPMDALVARALVEVGLYSLVYAAALVLLGWIGYDFVPYAPLELAAISAVLLAFGFGLAMLFAVAIHTRPRVQGIIGLLFLPLYLASGVIFPLHSFPPTVREWLLWNPVLHLIELSRGCFIEHYDVLPGVGWAYPTAFTLVAFAGGLAAFRIYRHQFLAR